MLVALYPGTFDPMTNGHLDIVARAARLFERIIVLVADNPAKQPIFSAAERVQLIEEAVKDLPGHERITVDSYQGLTVD